MAAPCAKLALAGKRMHLPLLADAQLGVGAA